MRETFVNKKFSQEAQNIIVIANDIIERYSGLGLRLSLRQLYYQLVATNVVLNTEKSYDKVGNIIADARIAGLCDWDMIEDRNRNTVSVGHWDSPGQIVKACAAGYHIDKWARQPNYVEVMVEKQALEGVLEPVCREMDVAFTANKGYSSVTMMYNTGQRIRDQFQKRCLDKGLMPDKFKRDRRGHQFIEWMAEQGLITNKFHLTEKAVAEGYPRMIVCYMGDHDPSGIDMTRDVGERLRMFSDYTPIEVQRLALNMEQIDELNPPENPAKMSDSRAVDYVAKFGHSSWELDAVEPTAMAKMLKDAILEVRDDDLWDAAVTQEEAERKEISAIADKLDSKKRSRK